MTARTMRITPHTLAFTGVAWGEEIPVLVIHEYDNGNVIKTVKVSMRPVDVEELGRVLWDLRAKYEKALQDMTAALRGPL